MAANDYEFTTLWTVPATIEEVAEILGDAASLPRWWPAVYLAVTILEPGDSTGVGRLVSLHTKGWLPYTLRWQFRVTESNAPHGFRLQALGDFVGEGIWTFTQHGDQADIRYYWRVQATKPLLRRLSFLLKPLFAANHRWAMRTGETSLRLELARRRAATPAERQRIPPPPAAVLIGLLIIGPPLWLRLSPWLGL